MAGPNPVVPDDRGSKTKAESNPPLEPEGVVALAWASLAVFSGDPNKQELGKEAIQQMQSMANDFPPDSPNRLYLIHLNDLFLNSLRSLSNRLEGMTQYFKQSSSLEQTKIAQAQALGNVSGDVTSLIPRVGASVGGLSILPILTKVANVAIPSVGGLSGYEILLFGAFVGYLAAELLLRLYSFLAVPRIIKAAQFERHQAYNRFLREAKEVLTNLTVNVTRLREQHYPNLGTLGKNRFYYDATVDLDSKRKLADAINDLVDRVTPSIHDDLVLRRCLTRGRVRGWTSVVLEPGDTVVGSFSVEGARKVNVFLVKGLGPDEAGIDVSSPEFSSVDADACLFRFSVKDAGKHFLIFENKSVLRKKTVTYSLQAIKGESVNLFPRN